MWFTDTQITAIPAFAELTPQEVSRVAGDAGALYQQVSAHPGVSDEELRAWAEAAEIYPAQYNQAMSALAEAGKVVDISGGPITPTAGDAPRLSDALEGESSVPASALQASELRAAAERMKLDVPKSASKNELADAIRQAAAQNA